MMYMYWYLVIGGIFALGDLKELANVGIPWQIKIWVGVLFTGLWMLLWPIPVLKLFVNGEPL